MKKFALSLLAITAISFCASQAFALDRYQSRTGFYAHASGVIGGGAAHGGQDRNVSTQRRLDGGAGLGLGFGINEMFVLGGEVLWTGQKTTVGSINAGGIFQSKSEVFNHEINVLGGVDVFIIQGFVVGLQGGLAINKRVAETKTTTLGNTGTSKTEGDALVGGGIRPSIGYEGFVNSDLAIGGRFFYLRNFYSDFDYDTFGAALTIRWY